MKLNQKLLAATIIAAGLSGLAGSAGAGVIGSAASYTLNISTCCGSGPFGTVSLFQTTADKISVNVTLNAGYVFANTGTGTPFSFNLGSGYTDAVVALTSGTSTFLVSPVGTYTNSPYGTFTNAIDFKSGIGGGISAGITTPITFTVSKTGIAFSNFIASTANGGQPGGYLFSSDVGNPRTGVTGNVVNGEGSTGDNGKPVPEPMSLALAGIGIMGLALARRQKRS